MDDVSDGGNDGHRKPMHGVGGILPFAPRWKGWLESALHEMGEVYGGSVLRRTGKIHL